MKQLKSHSCAPKLEPSPMTVKAPRAETPLVAALERWIAVAGITKGEPLFRSMKKGGNVRHIRDQITDDGVNVLLKARVARYPSGLRVPARDRDQRGGEIQWTFRSRRHVHRGFRGGHRNARARHKGLHVAQKYARNVDQLQRAPSKNPALAT